MDHLKTKDNVPTQQVHHLRPCAWGSLAWLWDGKGDLNLIERYSLEHRIRTAKKPKATYIYVGRIKWTSQLMSELARRCMSVPMLILNQPISIFSLCVFPDYQKQSFSIDQFGLMFYVTKVFSFFVMGVVGQFEKISYNCLLLLISEIIYNYTSIMLTGTCYVSSYSAYEQ